MNFVVIEDDPYAGASCFEGMPVPPIKTFDRSGARVDWARHGVEASGTWFAGSGWVNAVPDIVRRMAAHKSDHGSCPLMQRIVTQLFQNGKVDQHIAALSTVHWARSS